MYKIGGKQMCRVFFQKTALPVPQLSGESVPQLPVGVSISLRTRFVQFQSHKLVHIRMIYTIHSYKK